MVVVDAQVALTQRLVRMDDDLKSMAVHAAALVAERNVGQSVRRLEDVAPPDMRMALTVEIYTFVRRALDANLLDARNIQMRPDPTCEVLVGRLLNLLVQQAIVELSDSRFKGLAQAIDLPTGKPCPATRQVTTNLSQEAMAMQSPRAVADREDVDVPRSLEPRSCREERFRFQHHVIPNRT